MNDFEARQEAMCPRCRRLLLAPEACTHETPDTWPRYKSGRKVPARWDDKPCGLCIQADQTGVSVGHQHY